MRYKSRVHDRTNAVEIIDQETGEEFYGMVNCQKQMNKQADEIERLKESQRYEDALDVIQENDAEYAELKAENKRLRVAAQAVVDDWYRRSKKVYVHNVAIERLNAMLETQPKEPSE